MDHQLWPDSEEPMTESAPMDLGHGSHCVAFAPTQMGICYSTLKHGLATHSTLCYSGKSIKSKPPETWVLPLTGCSVLRTADDSGACLLRAPSAAPVCSLPPSYLSLFLLAFFPLKCHRDQVGFSSSSSHGIEHKHPPQRDPRGKAGSMALSA